MATSLYDRFLAETKPAAPTSLYDQFLASQKAPANGAEKLHAEFKSGALAKRMQGENARDVANASDEEAAAPNYTERLATHVLNTGQGIPGVGAVEAGAGALGSQFTDHPMSYRESYNTLHDNTEQIGSKTSKAEHLMGSLATLPFLPQSPAISGAIIGGADQVLDADPDKSLTKRAVTGTIGAASGAVLGKGAELIGTAGRAALATPVAQKLMDMQGARAAKAAVTYAAALLQGKGRTGTPQIQQWLASPDIREIAEELGTTREFNGVAHDDPRMLDAIYKVLSDRAQVVDKGLTAVTPNRPNIGRFQQRDIAAAQEEGLDAMSGGTSLPGPMPAYRKAVGDYAGDSRNIDALERGNDALKNRLSTTMTAGRNLDRTTPEALQGWAQAATAPERQAATEGVLGGLKGQTTHLGRVLGVPLIPQPSRALRVAPDVLRNIDPARQRIIDAITKAGLLGVNAEMQ